MLGQRSGRIILGNPEAGNVTVIRLLQQPKGGAGYCDSLDILLQWNSAPFTAGDAIPLSIQIKGAGLVIRAFLSRFEIPRPRPSSSFDHICRVERSEFILRLSLPLTEPYVPPATLCSRPCAASEYPSESSRTFLRASLPSGSRTAHRLPRDPPSSQIFQEYRQQFQR